MGQKNYRDVVYNVAHMSLDKLATSSSDSEFSLVDSTPVKEAPEIYFCSERNRRCNSKRIPFWINDLFVLIRFSL